MNQQIFLTKQYDIKNRDKDDLLTAVAPARLQRVANEVDRNFFQGEISQRIFLLQEAECSDKGKDRDTETGGQRETETLRFVLHWDFTGLLISPFQPVLSFNYCSRHSS
jgi:hypothetical protein